MFRTYTILLVLFFFGTTTMAQPVAERSLFALGYLPGCPIYVSISITRNNEDISVMETPPANWEISEIITEGGSVSNGIITWNLLQRDRQKNLSYVLLPPDTASGDAVFSGKIGDTDIGGDTTMNEITPEPIGIFKDHYDYPGHNPPGYASFDNSTGEYYIECGHLGGQEPEIDMLGGHYCYIPVYGSFSFEAKIEFGNTHRFNAAVISVGLPYNYPSPSYSLSPGFFLQKFTGGVNCGWQEAYDVTYDWFELEGDASRIGQKLKIVRKGDLFQSYHTNPETGGWVLIHSMTIHMVDPVYATIGAKTFTPSNKAQIFFSDVILESIKDTSHVQKWELY